MYKTNKPKCYLIREPLTHLYPPSYAKKLNKGKMIMENPLAISTPLGEIVEVNYMYRSCEIMIGDSRLYADLIELPIL